jgi:hypothetical protein
MLTFEVKAGGGPPAGLYTAKFLTVESTRHQEYGPGLKFFFEIIGGDHNGERTSRITNDSPTPKNAAGRMLAGIIGEALTPGSKIDLTQYVGRQFLIEVENMPNGTRISSIMPNWSKL